MLPLTFRIFVITIITPAGRKIKKFLPMIFKVFRTGTPANCINKIPVDPYIRTPDKEKNKIDNVALPRIPPIVIETKRVMRLIELNTRPVFCFPAIDNIALIGDEMKKNTAHTLRI